MSPYEYELKYLSKDPKALERFFSFIWTFHSHPRHLKKVERYSFDTVYYDEPDRRFREAGFSLRSRDKQNNFKPSIELKSLEGTKRIELTARGGCLLSAYFNLLAMPDYPIDAPRPRRFVSEMDKVMTIGADRKVFDLKFLPFKADAELCFDKIYYSQERKVPDEYEVEIEFKGITDDTFDRLVDFFRTEIEPKFPDVQRTTLSKAQRGYNRHEPKATP